MINSVDKKFNTPIWKIDRELKDHLLSNIALNLGVTKNNSEIKKHIEEYVKDHKSFAEHDLIGSSKLKPSDPKSYWTPYCILSGFADIEETRIYRSKQDFGTTCVSKMNLPIDEFAYISLKFGNLNDRGMAGYPTFDYAEKYTNGIEIERVYEIPNVKYTGPFMK